MKKLLICALLIPFIVSASDNPIKVNKPVMCDDTKSVMDALVNGEFKEVPVWSGTGEQSNFGLLINQQTGTWTLVEFNKEVTCVLGIGEKSRALSFGKKTIL